MALRHAKNPGDFLATRALLEVPYKGLVSFPKGSVPLDIFMENGMVHLLYIEGNDSGPPEYDVYTILLTTLEPNAGTYHGDLPKFDYIGKTIGNGQTWVLFMKAEQDDGTVPKPVNTRIWQTDGAEGR